MTTAESETNDPTKMGHDSSSPLEDVTLRRNNRGCKSKDFYDWPSQPLEEMDSPLAVQQYIQQLIHKDPSNIDEILKLPEGQDLGAWKIEHLRLFCMQLNRLAAKLQDCCLPETCKQMTATEQWIFLCAAHKQPSECPAIDYTVHTLDGAASLLNNGKYFPSRVTIKESSVAKLASVCRRVYRIFSHAYYHHFQVFDEFERETHLCKRFSKFVTTYELMSKESLIVPAEPPKTTETQATASVTTASATTSTSTSTATIATTATAATTTATTATTTNPEPAAPPVTSQEGGNNTSTSEGAASTQLSSTTSQIDLNKQGNTTSSNALSETAAPTTQAQKSEDTAATTTLD